MNEYKGHLQADGTILSDDEIYALELRYYEEDKLYWDLYFKRFHDENIENAYNSRENK